MFYSDINLNFSPHPLTGDFTFLANEAAVKRSLLHIAKMLPYDIPFQPDWHGHIRELLFEPPTDATASVLEQRIKWAIGKLEPRAEVTEVNVTLAANEAGYNVSVSFGIVSLLEQHTIDFYMERIR